MKRFFRVWLAFLGFMGTMFAIIALLLLPGLLVARATDRNWLGLGVTLLFVTAMWTWFTISPLSRRLADRLGAFITSIERPDHEHRA